MFDLTKKQANTRGQHDKVACLSLALVLLILYGLCQNGQWVPGGGDDAYYLAIARNLANGQGYFWNGEPVLETPPGWPVALALLMQVSTSFAFLNLVLMAMCITAACVWYFILRRFTTPLCAWFVVLLACTLFEWHRFTFTFYSESLFFLLLAVSLLLAIQINEGRGGIYKIAILLALSIAMVSVRWTGLLVMAVPASALVSGDLWPKFNRKWLAVVVLIAASLVTFKAIRHLQTERANRILTPEAGRVRDFQSLRHTFGSLLAASGVHPKTAQELMRHSDINMTMSRYTHTYRGQESNAVAGLPDLSLPSQGKQKALATGTDDRPVNIIQDGSKQLTPKLTPFLTPTAFSGCGGSAMIGTKQCDARKIIGSDKGSSGGELDNKSDSLSSNDITKKLTRLKGFEPLTFGSVDRRSIQLS